MRLPISELVGKIGEALSKTPVEQEAAKTAEALAAETPSIAQHLPDVPYAGSAAMRPFVRATAAPPPADVQSLIQKTKAALGGFIQAEPNLPKEYQQMFLDARYGVATAPEKADNIVLRQVVAPLSGDVKGKARLMDDYLTLADEFSDLHSRFVKDPNTPVYGRGGATLDQVEEELSKVTAAMRQHPDVVQAAQGFRQVTDQLFQDMVGAGLIAPTRYRQDWTPRQQIMEIAKGMSEAYGDQSVGGDVLSMMERRTMTGGVTETNMVDVLRKVLREFHEKMAGDALVNRILSDPTLNRTDEFANRPGAILPENWGLYRPHPGMPGFKIPEADARVAQGIAHQLGVDARILTPGTHVLPKDMIARLENFYPPPVRKGAEDTAYKIGRAIARTFTVYNPANTAMNAVSDLGVALLGLPGEHANPMGVLRFLPMAVKESWRGAFGKNSPLFERGVLEGLGESTFVEATGGAHIPDALAPALGLEPKTNLAARAANVMRRARLAVEMTPRLAAGLAEEARTGNPADFGRVGRAITLPYGAGAPAHTRSPFFRFAAPFVQFIGLATDRTAKLLTTPGSRGRAWASILGVPVAAFMWNMQNQSYRDVEYSLNRRDRYTPHIIMPGPDGRPAVDRNGKAIVMRFRFFVPDNVAEMVGLSNLPSRITDLVTGRATVGEELSASGETMLQQAGQQIIPAQIVAGLTTGKNLQTGQDQPRSDILLNSVPIIREVREGIQGTMNAGPVEGAKNFAESVSSIRFAPVAGKGRADADIQDLKIRLRDTRTQMRSAFRKGDVARAQQLKKDIYRIANRLRAINAARRKSRRVKS